MSGVRHREEGVAQEGRSSLPVCLGERDQKIHENQLKKEGSRPSVTEPTRGEGGGSPL